MPHVEARSRAGAAEQEPALIDAVRRFGDLIYRSEAMARTCQILAKIAATDAAVLIEGETGSGKELAAHAVHAASLRGSKPFISVNAGSLTDSLLESELFGHRRGAFSGAYEHKTGLFEAADSGSLFLDEIGESTPALQVRLLRLLETGAFRKVGGIRERVADVRIIAATNRSLLTEANRGRFRADLYFRLNVFSVRMPPLRDRPEDIPVLAQHFADECASRWGLPRRALPPRILESLARRPWRGNVRELRNVIHQTIATSPEEDLRLPDVSELLARPQTVRAGADRRYERRIKTLAEVEREHLLFALEQFGGNQTKAARAVGLNRSTFRFRLKRSLN